MVWTPSAGRRTRPSVTRSFSTAFAALIGMAKPMPAFWPTFEEELDDLAEVGTRPVTHVVSGAAQLTGRIEVLPAEGHTEGDLLVLILRTRKRRAASATAARARRLGV